ncbi:hypothetical protein U9M48_006587 [Paspalum notatum var. saurae]|uniref:O-methyltransferase n=1 Tax=Paspalum notatum var. saurae TaxID=547442 RepID=A0AAQ3SKQ0_PASNO
MGYTTTAAFQHDTTNDDEGCMYALELLGCHAVPMTINAADGRTVTPEELAARWPRPAEAAVAVDRMLRYLASYSVVRCTTEVAPDGKARRSYAAAPVCKWFTTRNGGMGSLAPVAMMYLDKEFMEIWYYMKDAVAEGVTPSEKAYGMPLFEHLGSNEASSTLFNQAMAGQSEIITKKLLELYRGFEGVDVLVDVGGATLRMITAQHKHVRGVNYDLPHVIAQAPPIKGVEHCILHNWGDEECAKILRNCHSALPADGKVIVVEYVLRERPEPTLAAQGVFHLDVVMLCAHAGGKERTERELAQLAAEAGFSGGCKATYIFANAWALEFTK